MPRFFRGLDPSTLLHKSRYCLLDDIQPPISEMACFLVYRSLPTRSISGKWMQMLEFRLIFH